MKTPLRVLLVEDSEDDALLLLHELRRGGYEPSHVRVDTAAALERALEEREWDIVISDHSMPAFSSSAALELLRQKGYVDLPFIIVSGRIGEDTAVAAMKAGAHDYIMKDNLARLNSAIERELRDVEVRRERRRAEEAFKSSETRFRLMIEQSPLSVQIFSPDGRTLRVNRAWEELWGVTLEQIPGYNVLEDSQLTDKGIMPYIERGFAGEAVAIPPVRYEPEATIPDVSNVSHRWVRAFIYPVKDESGSIQEVVLIHEDITERKEAEDARLRAEKKYRKIFENAIEGIFQTTVDGRFITANPALARIYGYESPADLIASIVNLKEQLYVDPERRTEMVELISRHGTLSGFEAEMYRKDGSKIWTSLTVGAIRESNGELVGYEGTVEDITGRKRAELELREAREAERRRLARDLHDVVLQDLTYAMQSMQMTQMKENDAELKKELDGEIEALRDVMGGLRDAIYNLRLEGDRERFLVRSLESLVELNRQMAPERETELVVEEGFPEVPAGEAGVELLRVVQEALVNVRRHSGSRHARVVVAVADGEVRVEVEDDGKGFDPEMGAGMGLTGMRERARALGGKLGVESQPGAGTRVWVRVALSVLAPQSAQA